MKTIKNIVQGTSYLTWLICNISIVYWLGVGVVKLIEAKSVGAFLIQLSVGAISLLLIAILSLLILALIASFFGDKKVEKKLDEIFPNMGL